MEKMKHDFLRFLKEDKANFLFVCFKLTLLFLFFLAIVLPIASNSNASLSIANFPSIGGLFVLVIWLIILSYLYAKIVRSEKLEKFVNLVLIIFVTVTFLWGVIVYFISTEYAGMGFGFVLLVFMTIILWFLKLKEPLFYNLIKKTFVKSDPVPITIVEPVVEPIAEPVVVPEPIVVPVVVPKPEPVVEPKAEPVVKPEPEPVVKPEPEPVTEQEPEPIEEEIPKA